MLQRDVEGNSQCIIGINYDISDRKLAEIQLQLFNEELLKATKLKDEFLANMSHELRTPLTAILGMSEILSKEIVGGLVERQHKAVNAIYTSGQHLLALINDILDLSKVAAGKMELHIELVSVKKLCDSSLVFVKQQAFQKDICISCNISDNIKKIAVDERRMRQVLINLLTNAVKFTPVGGNIKLSVTISQDNIQTNMQTNMQRETTAPRQVRFLTPMILFQVRDNGIGIAAKDLPRLFQAFVQIDSSLTREYEGTGLGLAMVKQIVELHDGQVLAESQLARGSCFTVALPYAHHLIAAIEKEELTAITTADSTPAADNTPNNQPNQLVLIAEDNEANIETFREYISAYNYRIIIAKNGLEAVTLAESHRPDIILMDIQMPKMDGLKAIRLIKASAELSSIPIIALTARTMEDDRAICIEAGANEYISKPVQLESLVTTIQQFLTITA
jgi:signal transduction histidine kinase/CheY-like chemotaxis protein